VRYGYNIFAVTEKGEVRGKVESALGKTARFKMDKKITGKVVYVFFSFYSSSDIFLWLLHFYTENIRILLR
jgi:hypothetical protein